MNSTALATRTQHALTFGSHEIKSIKRDGEVWMSGSEVGRALAYADPETAIKKLYSRNSDEFTSTMTKIIKVATAGGKQAIRFFSLRGAHLLAMFARTDKAKEFRVWVLNILDREADGKRAEDQAKVALDRVQAETLENLCRETEYINAWWNQFGPAVEVLNQKLYGKVFEQFGTAAYRARHLVKELGFKSYRAYFEGYPWHGSYTDSQLYLEDCRKRGIA